MKIVKKQVNKFQEGGAMPVGAAVPAEAPQGQGGADQIVQIAAQIIQEMGPDGAAMLAQAIMELLQQMSQQAPVGEQPEGEPVFKKGGKICKRVKKCTSKKC